MEIKTSIPNEQFFDDLLAKFEKQMVNLDYNDMACIKRCKDITVFDAYKEAECDSDSFVENFLSDVYKRIEGKQLNQVLVCIGQNSSCPILIETLAHLNTFCDNFNEDTEIKWGIYETQENEPMRLIVATGY